MEPPGAARARAEWPVPGGPPRAAPSRAKPCPAGRPSLRGARAANSPGARTPAPRPSGSSPPDRAAPLARPPPRLLSLSLRLGPSPQPTRAPRHRAGSSPPARALRIPRARALRDPLRRGRGSGPSGGTGGGAGGRAAGGGPAAAKRRAPRPPRPCAPARPPPPPSALGPPPPRRGHAGLGAAAGPAKPCQARRPFALLACPPTSPDWQRLGPGPGGSQSPGREPGCPAPAATVALSRPRSPRTARTAALAVALDPEGGKAARGLLGGPHGRRGGPSQPLQGAPLQPALADGCAPRDLGALLVRTRPAQPTDGRRALLETAGVRGRAVSGSWRGRRVSRLPRRNDIAARHRPRVSPARGKGQEKPSLVRAWLALSRSFARSWAFAASETARSRQPPNSQRAPAAGWSSALGPARARKVVPDPGGRTWALLRGVWAAEEGASAGTPLRSRE